MYRWCLKVYRGCLIPTINTIPLLTGTGLDLITVEKKNRLCVLGMVLGVFGIKYLRKVYVIH